MDGNEPAYSLSGDLYTDLRMVFENTISCWIATRIHGASASLACDQGTIDVGLLRYLDGRFGKMVRAERKARPDHVWHEDFPPGGISREAWIQHSEAKGRMWEEWHEKRRNVDKQAESPDTD